MCVFVHARVCFNLCVYENVYAWCVCMWNGVHVCVRSFRRNKKRDIVELRITDICIPTWSISQILKIRTRSYENVLRDDNDSSFSEDSANDDDTDNSSTPT